MNKGLEQTVLQRWCTAGQHTQLSLSETKTQTPRRYLTVSVRVATSPFLYGKSVFMKTWGNWNSCALLYVFSMGNNVAIPESINGRITIWQFHFWKYTKRTQMMDSMLLCHVHSSIIYNWQTGAITQVFTKRWMEKQNMVYT